MSTSDKWWLAMTTLLVTFDLPSLVAAVTNARISDGSQGAWRTETPAEEPTLREGAALCLFGGGAGGWLAIRADNRTRIIQT